MDRNIAVELAPYIVLLACLFGHALGAPDALLTGIAGAMGGVLVPKLAKSIQQPS